MNLPVVLVLNKGEKYVFSEAHFEIKQLVKKRPRKNAILI